MNHICTDSLLNKNTTRRKIAFLLYVVNKSRKLWEKKSLNCVVHRIHYHLGLATELRGLLPKFTRVLNARDIMSDKIPDMSEPDEFPYCIWYPETAKEETYRVLAIRYPQK
ncbi:hypothetical protein Asppvi_001834 [Aspergillus pseudoviridinutans]|uniref:Uncharacterized protein n=1 Tax=Aspergillus pseudoviridinutans TaxID=1517512 RepID=A0A9P3BRW4_9EURO|nr:uncharacterized protein Asppvi_001834 [Aspergillus pseudoviridinutans]GIJ92556.1 hypothetical protein Asppvi_001834 [Aspergillus pseudoviridinutans]